MADEQIEKLREMQASVGGEDVFNQGLKGILFGKGMTMIFMFKGGFSYYTDSEAEGGKMESVRRRHIFISCRIAATQGTGADTDL